MFISAEVITLMVKAENAKSETQYTPKQPTTTTNKLNNVLTSRTLRDLTYKLDPYKKNLSDSQLTTLTHILECYDHTLKILQSLDIDSQSITQSSKAIQTRLENLNIVFLTLYNASQVNFTFFFLWYTSNPIQVTSLTFCNLFETFLIPIHTLL